jgi:multidrug resistance efflux pump
LKEVIETVYSPCSGKVENLFVSQGSYVYEWEKLMVVHTTDNKKVEIQTGVSGHVVSIEVTKNQNVSNKTVLIKLKDDLLITGSE